MATATVRLEDVVQLNDLDRRIWGEEPESFVPKQVYDLHTHIGSSKFDLGTVPGYSGAGGAWGLLQTGTTTEMLNAADELLMPGRQVSRLAFPIPNPKCDFQGSNEYLASEVRKDPMSAALMLVHPGMTAGKVDEAIRKHRFLGFKCYRWYSVTGDPKNCRILDFMSEHILEVGNRYGLIVGLHVAKADAIADQENLEDLERMSAKYPRLRWALFHCARSYSSWPLEAAAPRLRNIPNIWYEGSSVCETDAFDALFSFADPTRVCYGSDDLAVGVGRGKYIAYGRAWVSMHEQNQTFNADHCDGRMTFVRYEMLRAMKHAARHAGYGPGQIENLFYNNAVRLIQDTRRDLDEALGPSDGIVSAATPSIEISRG
jgi:glutamate-1-semialdehyde 2,1-aminomutase